MEVEQSPETGSNQSNDISDPRIRIVQSDEYESQSPQSNTQPLERNQSEASPGNQKFSESFNTGDPASSPPGQDPPQMTTTERTGIFESKDTADRNGSESGKDANQEATISEQNSIISWSNSADDPAVLRTENFQGQRSDGGRTAPEPETPSDQASSEAERNAQQLLDNIKNRASEPKRAGDRVIGNTSKPSQSKNKDDRATLGKAPQKNAAKQKNKTSKAKKSGQGVSKAAKKKQQEAEQEFGIEEDEGGIIEPGDGCTFLTGRSTEQDHLDDESAVKEMESEMQTYKSTIHFLSQQVDLDDNQIKTYEQAIVRLTKRISRLEKSIARRRSGKRGIEPGNDVESDDISSDSHRRNRMQPDPTHECQHTAGMMFFDADNFGYIPKPEDDMRSYLKGLNHRISMRIHREKMAKAHAEREEEIRRRAAPEQEKQKKGTKVAAAKKANTGRTTRSNARRGSPEEVVMDDDDGDGEQDVDGKVEGPGERHNEPVLEEHESEAEEEELEDGQIDEREETIEPEPKGKARNRTAAKERNPSAPKTPNLVGIYRKPTTAKGRPAQKMFDRVLDSHYLDNRVQYRVRHFGTDTVHVLISYDEIINDDGRFLIEMFHVNNPNKPKAHSGSDDEGASDQHDEDNKTDVTDNEQDELEGPIRSTATGKNAATAKKPTGRTTNKVSFSASTSNTGREKRQKSVTQPQEFAEIRIVGEDDSDVTSLSSEHSSFGDEMVPTKAKPPGRGRAKALNTSPEPRRTTRTTARQGKAVPAAKTHKTRSKDKASTSKKRPSPEPEEGPRKKGRGGR